MILNRKLSPKIGGQECPPYTFHAGNRGTRTRAPTQSGKKNPFYLTLLGCGIERDFEVVEEPVHPEESCNGQIFRESCSNVYDSPGREEYNVVKVVARRSVNAEGFFDGAVFNFQSDESANAGVKNTARGARVYDCLEAFCAGCILGGQRNANIQRCAVGDSPAVEWILFIR